jgi:hypothetical protein
MSRLTNGTMWAFLSGVLLALAPVTLRGTEPVQTAPREAADLGKLAKRANSPSDHLEVAKMYERRATTLDATADRLERELGREKATPPSVMETRWPAMVVNARERREQLAMQSRRAAEECFRLAAHHRSLAGDAAASE